MEYNINSYGQRDIPTIEIYFNGQLFNISDYYQDYEAIHKTNKKSKWIIKVALLPENLKEQLYCDYYHTITITEIHRSSETGEDTTIKYTIKHPKITIKEYQNCSIDDPIQYLIIIKGYMKKEN